MALCTDYHLLIYFLYPSISECGVALARDLFLALNNVVVRGEQDGKTQFFYKECIEQRRERRERSQAFPKTKDGQGCKT